MCLIPESEIKIAERDIKVYKKVNILVDSWIPSITGIGAYEFDKIIKATNNLKIEKSNLSNLDVIITGFHAFTNRVVLPNYPEEPNAIIPKGSEYCIGRNGDIVANQIIVFRNNKELENMLIPTSEIKIAKEPIIVSKDLGNIDSWFFGLFKYWNSPNYQTKERRRFGKAYKACEHLVIENNAIYQGFHAYRDTPEVHAYFFPNAVIPKGAEYCYGKYNDVVATEIIVFRTKRQFYKYLKKNELQ